MDTASPEPQEAAPPSSLLMDVLMDELLLKVMMCLDAAALAQLALVCTAFARLCRKDEIWAPLCRQAFRGKQCAHAFPDALAAGEARGAYGLVHRDVWQADTYKNLVENRWFRQLCNRAGGALGFQGDLPTICNLHWRMRFTEQAGGGPGSTSYACKFKPAESEGSGASSGMLELEGYPDLSWTFKRAGGANPGFERGEVIMMIHDFPPHKIHRRCHRAGLTTLSRTMPLLFPAEAEARVLEAHQPLPHSGDWGWIIRNANVIFWTHDPALLSTATAQKDIGNEHYRSGAHDAARANYLECLELLGANPLGCPHLEWRHAVLSRVRARAEDMMQQYPSGPKTLHAPERPFAWSNFWEAFRWNRTLAANLTGDDTPEGRRGHLDYEADEDLITEEQNAYIDLLTDEERTLHATALSNYAMAAIATLRQHGMSHVGEEPWQWGSGSEASFKHDATASEPCLYIKVSSGDAGPRTVPLVVDATTGEDLTIGQVKALIVEANIIDVMPTSQQQLLVYFGGVLLQEHRTLRDCAIQLDRGVYTERGRPAFVWTRLLHVVNPDNPGPGAAFLDEDSDSSRLAQDAWLACVQVFEMFRGRDAERWSTLGKKVFMRKMELERGALGLLYDTVEGKVVVAPTGLPGSFRCFAEWCHEVQWGRSFS
jgi:hypothetical protein